MAHEKKVSTIHNIQRIVQFEQFSYMMKCLSQNIYVKFHPNTTIRPPRVNDFCECVVLVVPTFSFIYLEYILIHNYW